MLLWSGKGAQRYCRIAWFLLAVSSALGLSVIIFMMAGALSHKQILDFNSMSPFECGFEKSEMSLFSLRYFLVALIFLLFDLEVLLLFPSTSKLDFFFGGGLTAFLTLGLFWEWNQTLLDWSS